jgi:hypothetical protein
VTCQDPQGHTLHSYLEIFFYFFSLGIVSPVLNATNVFTFGGTWEKALQNSKAAHAATIDQCLAEAGMFLFLFFFDLHL